MHSADYAGAQCPSICLSHAGIISKRLNEYCQTFSPLGSHTILVFFTPNGMAIIRRRLPKAGVECRGYERIAIFGQYLALSRKWYKIEPYSCYKMRIGNRTQAFEWYHFEWPWVILSDLVKNSMTRSIERFLCDSWTSCVDPNRPTTRDP